MKRSGSSPRSWKRPPTVFGLRKEKARRWLHEYIRQAWELVEPDTEFVDNWHLRAISEHLEAVSGNQIRRLLINVPPRSMKSLSVSVFWPTWEWIERPHTRWLFSSYAAVLSTRDSLKCRRIIESRWYRERWGGAFRLTTDQNVKNRFENDKTGHRIATSVDGVATGDGGDIICVDDPHNVQEIHSDTTRESVLRWWDESMTSRFNNPKTGRAVIVMQRMHERDLSGHLLAKEMGWEHLCLPMEHDGRKRMTSLGPYDVRKEEGELLWPAHFDRKAVEELKKGMGSYSASGQLQQAPSPAGGGIFKRNDWRYYKAFPELREVVLSFDMAFKQLSDSDFVVGQAWGRKDADKYLLEQVRARMGFGASVQAVRQLKAKFPQARAILIEDKANGTAVIEVLKREIPGIISVEPEGGKITRAYAIQPEQEAGNIHLPDPVIAPWVGGFVEECSSFPLGANDDQVDAMTQAVNWFRRRVMPGCFVV
jgi:predicted phage terminase large subunit-like protein